jgi:hypothetical protein
MILLTLRLPRTFTPPSLLYTPRQMGKYVHPPAPEQTTKLSDHFSGLLFSGDVFNTLLEIGLVSTFFIMPADWGPIGSMSPRTVGYFSIAQSLFTRLYNTYLEAAFFAFPQYRTQPAIEHKLIKNKQDLTGRQVEQQEKLVFHDRLTLITGAMLNLALYLLIPGFYPDPAAVKHTILTR